MAMLGHWLGFDTTGSPTQRPEPRPAQRGIVISDSKKRKSASNQTKDSDTTLRKTKSDELLRDFEVMRFLCRIDERLKEDGALLSTPDLDRLQTLHAQACADECTVLTDIIEHFEMENDKLRHRLAQIAPSSAADDAVRARRNMLVC